DRRPRRRACSRRARLAPGAELLHGARVENVRALEPRPPRDADAVTQEAQLTHAVRVAVDDDRHAELARHRRPVLAHVEAQGRAVQLDRGADLGERAQDRLQVDLARLADAELTPGGVPKAVDLAALDRLDDALGHLVLRHAEVRVDAPDDPV